LNSYYAQNKITPLHILEVNEMDLLIEFAKMGIGVVGSVKPVVLAHGVTLFYFFVWNSVMLVVYLLFSIYASLLYI
jgi:hypothetical protein